MHLGEEVVEFNWGQGEPTSAQYRSAHGGYGRPQITYFTVRGQSYYSRLPKYWPPIPLSTRRVCPPPATKAGGTHSPGREGDGGSIHVFWKTRDIGLPSYSKICTLCGRPKQSCLCWSNYTVAKFINPWLGDKVNSGIGLSYQPARSPCSLAVRCWNFRTICEG